MIECWISGEVIVCVWLSVMVIVRRIRRRVFGVIYVRGGGWKFVFGYGSFWFVGCIFIWIKV